MIANSTNRIRRNLEGLEERALMSVTANVSNGILRITGTEAADRITVREQSGMIWLDNVAITSGGRSYSYANSTSVTRVEIDARGGDDVINLCAYPTQTLTKYAIVWSGSGNDSVYGGNGADAFYGNDGNDYLYGGGGQDYLEGDGGFDRYGEQYYTNQPVINGCQVTDIRQGNLGTCQTLSVMAELAGKGYDFGRNIRYLGGTTYAVSLRGGQATVNVAFDGTWNDNDPTPTGNQAEFWPILMQRARLQYWSVPYDHEMNTQEENYYEARVAQLANRPGLNFRDQALAIYDFTGSTNYYQYSTNALTSTSGSQIQTALRNGWRFVADSYYSPAGNAASNAYGIVANHAYSVTDVYQDASGWKVRLYNPWGVDGIGALRDGYVTLTLDQFRASFSVYFAF